MREMNLRLIARLFLCWVVVVLLGAGFSALHGESLSVGFAIAMGYAAVCIYVCQVLVSRDRRAEGEKEVKGVDSHF